MSDVDLTGLSSPSAVRLGPLCLSHPLINASGTLELLELAETFGDEILELPPVAAYVPKTITLEPRQGNPPPRVLETSAGLINSVGLPNEGLDAFLEGRLPRLLELPCPLILSIGGFSVNEYEVIAARLRSSLDAWTAGRSEHGLPGPAPAGVGRPGRVSRRVTSGSREPAWLSRVGLELNISCPNVRSGCMSIGTDPEGTAEVVAAVREVWPGLLVAKLTPNVTDIVAVGLAAVKAGADALAAVNTFKGLVIDRVTLRPYLGSVSGGLSGPAIKPLALHAIYELYEATDRPLIGMGGVCELQDVLDFLACGARVVAVGSAAFRDPLLAARLAEALQEELIRRQLTVTELVGCAHR